MSVPAVLLVLLGPVVLREPIGQGDWRKKTDPVQRRVASLLAGEPVRAGVVAVVPLFARVPSEAGNGVPEMTSWLHPEVTGRVLFEDNRYYLRVINPSKRPVFVPAGTVFLIQKREVYIARDAVVPPEFAALFPARPAHAGKFPGDQDHGQIGVLPPLAVAALLHGQANFDLAAEQGWRRLGGGPRSFAHAMGHVQVRRRLNTLRARCDPLRQALDRTVVGAVFLIANRPASAHVFGSHDLFMDALPDLLHGVAMQSLVAERQAGGAAALMRQARLGDPRGRAVTFLRNTLDIRGEWRESYGAGFEVMTRAQRERAVGHAIVDHRRQVIHAAFYVLANLWPGKRAPNAPPGGPPVPPDDGGNETPPGQVDRKARPTLEEQRQRERRPGPTDGKGNTTGGKRGKPK